MAISGVTDYTNTYAANYAGATKGAKDTASAQQTTEEYISNLEKKYGIKISLVDFTGEPTPWKSTDPKVDSVD